MVKITKIEIKNFKAFRGPDEIILGQKGQNLLLYGENGSGKTSLYEALKFSLESSDGTHDFGNYRNIFTDKTDKGYIKLHFTPDPKSNKKIYEWSEDIQNETKVEPIIDASKATGFLDYKDLLKTNYLHQEKNDVNVNVFDLLINTLLKNVVNDQAVPTRSFFDQWSDILDIRSSVQEATQDIEDMQAQIDSFNIGLANQLAELQTRASEILRKFGYKDSVVALDFGFQGIEYNQEDGMLNYQNIPLKVKFLDQGLTTHYRFLNEGKLSAIALSIFFGGFQLQPPSDLKILVLDDVLIGLDMSNRLPLIDILDEYFSDYQIFLMTYDKAWYEIIKQRTKKEEWEYAELSLSPINEYGMPVYKKNKADLDKAKEYFAASDYKASAIYLRTAFEATLREYCNKKDLLVRYCEDPKELKTEDFWGRIKAEKKRDITFPDHEICLLDLVLVDKIQLYRRIILNPLSHATIENIQGSEVGGAIKAVERLKSELNHHLKGSKGQ